ncbi:Pectin acetylesterase 5 [Ananas comosus]|uniref:Pectin acetylesterase 5 n=1 Tax=Ananas comosus TaxID=4615 RepID=A0A199V539_ANACO|nr:Pectin acetylesterase 5 [Ananas comosus]
MAVHRLRLWWRRRRPYAAAGAAGAFVVVSAALVLTLSSWLREDEAPRSFSSDSADLVDLTLLKNAKEKGALCLDGSPAGYHLQRGFGSGSNSWLLHLEGGGWCRSLQSCTLRKLTSLGSSNYMERQIAFHGILSNIQSQNPDFYNWNKVKIRYCDGASFSGDVENELQNGTTLFFRGQRIWEAIMDELLGEGLAEAKQAFLTGCSSGGLATYVHCDNFRALLPKDVTVKCLADGGFFLDVNDIIGKRSMRSLYDDVVHLQCFFPQEIVKNMKTPTFILNSAYDAWQIQNVLAPDASDPQDSWLSFREDLLDALSEVKKKREWGMFIDSCFVHCQTSTNITWHSPSSPRLNDKTIAEAVGDWYFDRSVVKEIDCPFPCNPTCHNLVFVSPTIYKTGLSSSIQDSSDRLWRDRCVLSLHPQTLNSAAMVAHRLRLWWRRSRPSAAAAAAGAFVVVSAALVLTLSSWPREDEAPRSFSSDSADLVDLTLLKNAKEKGALCLDGSPAGYHLQRGFGSGSNSWLLHLEGGGWCRSLQSCALRKLTALGSSNYMERQIAFHGILSNIQSQNPDFYNWNKVKIRYCDGASFSGDVENELQNGTTLFFRGQRIWEAIMDELLGEGLAEAKQAFLTGCSAGGLATYIHCDDFHALLPKKVTVKCLADGGFFLDVNDIIGKRSMRSFYDDVVHLQIIKNMKTPTFILNPAYDAWQIQHVLAPNASEPQDSWLNLLDALSEVKKKKEWGMFIDSCFVHCQTLNNITWHSPSSPRLNDKTIAEAVGDWYFNRRVVKEIDCPFPCNPTCYNLVFAQPYKL